MLGLRTTSLGYARSAPSTMTSSYQCHGPNPRALIVGEKYTNILERSTHKNLTKFNVRQNNVTLNTTQYNDILYYQY